MTCAPTPTTGAYDGDGVWSQDRRGARDFSNGFALITKIAVSRGRAQIDLNAHRPFLVDARRMQSG